MYLPRACVLRDPGPQLKPASGSPSTTEAKTGLVTLCWQCQPAFLSLPFPVLSLEDTEARFPLNIDGLLPFLADSTVTSGFRTDSSTCHTAGMLNMCFVFRGLPLQGTRALCLAHPALSSLGWELLGRHCLQPGGVAAGGSSLEIRGLL